MKMRREVKKSWNPMNQILARTSCTPERKVRQGCLEATENRFCRWLEELYLCRVRIRKTTQSLTSNQHKGRGGATEFCVSWSDKCHFHKWRKYFLLFQNDLNHFRKLYFLKTKDEAATSPEIFLKMVENQFGRKVQCLRLLKELGVFHTFTNTHTPEKNGGVEREMMTVVEAARSVIHANNVYESLWAVVMYEVFTINQTSTS